MKGEKIYSITLELFEKFKASVPYSSNLYEFISKKMTDSEYKELEEKDILLNVSEDFSLNFSFKYRFLVDNESNESTQLSS
ncbi:hypothetical protein [Bernardetia sp.]|uniref:hypothetical protein n=1 Tax=Bernardetia sp. TaxID=1937974 RepID=UPI0025C287C4|nr:hypothetical protein [Bernardetia sp.]